MLYSMIDHVHQASKLGFNQLLGSPNPVLPNSLEDEVVSFNTRSLKEAFNKATYECGVCLGVLTVPFPSS